MQSKISIHNMSETDEIKVECTGSGSIKWLDIYIGNFIVEAFHYDDKTFLQRFRYQVNKAIDDFLAS